MFVPISGVFRALFERVTRNVDAPNYASFANEHFDRMFNGAAADAAAVYRGPLPGNVVIASRATDRNRNVAIGAVLEECDDDDPAVFAAAVRDLIVGMGMRAYVDDCTGAGLDTRRSMELYAAQMFQLSALDARGNTSTHEAVRKVIVKVDARRGRLTNNADITVVSIVTSGERARRTIVRADGLVSTARRDRRGEFAHRVQAAHVNSPADAAREDTAWIVNRCLMALMSDRSPFVSVRPGINGPAFALCLWQHGAVADTFDMRASTSDRSTLVWAKKDYVMERVDFRLGTAARA